MSVTVPLRRNRSTRLLGTPAEALTLAVRGGEHDGCVIRIRGAKCTIGSAVGCTLRLRSAGVSPLACWILRGPGGTVVRRRASDIQLNGRGFLDAPLSPGDRLRVGPVELEILGCPVAPPEAFLTPAALPEFNFEREELEQTAHDSTEAAAQLRQQLAAVERRATEQLAELNNLVGRLTQERDGLQATTQSLREDAAASSAEQNEFAAQRAAWHQERGSFDERCAKLQEQVARLQSELEAQRRQSEPASPAAAQMMTITMDQIRREAQDEQATLLRQREELVNEHQTLRTSFADLTNQLREAQIAQQQLDETSGQVQQLQAKSQALQTRIEELERELAEARSQEPIAASQEPGDKLQDAAELEAQRQQLASERQQLEAKCEQLLAGQQELQTLREQLESAQAAFADERRQVEELVRAKEQLLNRQAEELSDRLERVSGRQSELDTRQQELEEQDAQLRARLAQLQDQQCELEERKSTLDQQAAQLAELHGRLQQVGSEPVLEQPAETPDVVADESPAPQPQESENVESVLNRLVQAGLWRGDKDETPAPVESLPAEEPVAEVVAEEPAEPAELVEEPAPIMEEVAAPFEPAPAKPVWTERPVAAASGDDESIESYMDRLLKRVRGEAGGAPEKPATKYAAPTPAPQPKPAPVAEIKPVAAIEPVTAEEYVPRSQAPEQGVNLAAMRELANSAARSAIQTHAQSRGSKKAKGKLVGSFVCVVVSLVAAIVALRNGSWLLAGGGLVALAAAGYCGLDGVQHALGALKLGRPQRSETPELPADDAQLCDPPEDRS